MTDKLETSLRLQVAAATLLLNAEGILGYSGHVSARLPDGALFLVQTLEDSRAALSPDRLLVCDLEGHVIDGPRGAKAPAEVYIHAEIYRARPDVRAILHHHPDSATVFTLAEGARLELVKNHASRWAGGIPVHPDPSHIASPASGRALAATLGRAHAALIRAHGAVVVAEDVPALLVDAIHFDENARACYAARLLGPVLPLSADELSAFARTFDRSRHVRKLWAYYVGRGAAGGAIPAEWAPNLKEAAGSLGRG